MNNRLEETMEAALLHFGKIKSVNTIAFRDELKIAFSQQKPFMDKLAQLDRIFDNQPIFEALREPFFDLLMVNFFTEDVKKLEEDYLESAEWEAIEEKTLDRGTELLNILLYLRECHDESIEPELEDFLKEFLLVDEDEFQDEYRIYEDVIANQLLVDSSWEELAKVAKKVSPDSELKEWFYPMFAFFKNPSPSTDEFEKYVNMSENKETDAAIYALLVAYYKFKE